jgi:hypothetical protein
MQCDINENYVYYTLAKNVLGVAYTNTPLQYTLRIVSST